MCSKRCIPRTCCDIVKFMVIINNGSPTCDSFSNEEDKKLCLKANDFARENKKFIAKRLTDIKCYPCEKTPISVFMAGSPGAGKTEFTQRLIEELKAQGRNTPVRIDSDDIRKEFDGYTGKNSSLFQAASAIIVDKIYDYVIDNEQSVIFDGTFSSEKSIKNIHRSVDKGRPVQIFYIYQDPKTSWDFTQKREVLEGRNIPLDAFVDSLFKSKDNVNKTKELFKEKIILNVIERDFVNKIDKFHFNVTSVDHFIKIPYTKDDLKNLLK
jgi:UDP-N-acetylglucosamine kinase